MESILVSVVIPVYSGEATLEELAERLSRVRRDWNENLGGVELCELIFVNDGAKDRSGDVLRDLEAGLSWVRVITLSRNFGQHPATVAGILQTSGDWVVTLDEDLQHPPEAMLEMIEAAASQALDLVYAQPKMPVHSSFVRDTGSRTIKRMVSVFAGNPTVPHFNSFRTMRGSIARAASAVSAQETFFDVALSWFTESVGTVPMNLSDTRFSKDQASGYSLWRLLSHSRRMIVSSQTKWLRLAALVGIGGLSVSVGVGGFKLIQWVNGWEYVDVPGWASLFVAVLFFGGLSTLLAGILLEYMGIVVSKSLGKPAFFAVDRSRDLELVQLIAGYRSTQEIALREVSHANL